MAKTTKTTKKTAKPVKPAKKDAELKTKAPVEVETEVEIIETKENEPGQKEKYYEAVGRRKESIARVRLFTKKSSDTVEGERALIAINGKDYTAYFSDNNRQEVVESPLRKLKSLNRFKATV